MFLEAPMEVLADMMESCAEFWEAVWAPYVPFMWWL